MKQRTIVVVDYDPTWPQTFAALAQVVGGELGPLALAIEHVGSTSVPDLAAKPIIDLNVVIASRDDLPGVLAALAPLGYTHKGDGGIPGREQFAHDGPDVPRDGSGRDWPDHHLYVCAQGNREHRRQIAFRNHLRRHPLVAAEYGQLKRTLAERFPHDIEAYIAGKGPLIENVLTRAMSAADQP